jgi:hypothetical protein
MDKSFQAVAAVYRGVAPILTHKQEVQRLYRGLGILRFF